MILGKILSGMAGRNSFRYTDAGCGHRTAWLGNMVVFGRQVRVQLPTDKDDKVSHCLKCFVRMAVQCARCTKPIFVGDPITLLTPRKAGFEIPEHAHVYAKKPYLQLVGCLRTSCADTGADRAGFWVAGKDGKGEVLRVQTPYEQILSGDSNVVVVDDSQDIVEAINRRQNPTRR